MNSFKNIGIQAWYDSHFWESKKIKCLQILKFIIYIIISGCGYKERSQSYPWKTSEAEFYIKSKDNVVTVIHQPEHPRDVYTEKEHCRLQSAMKPLGENKQLKAKKVSNNSSKQKMDYQEMILP